jgi:hypothetical protein
LPPKEEQDQSKEAARSKDAAQSKDAAPSKDAARSNSSKESPSEADIGQDEPQASNTTSEADFIDEASVRKGKGEKAEEQEPLGNKELDIVLSIPSPSEIKGKGLQRHPHLEPPPYEHHFDTYGLVQQLAAKDAYSVYQATTLMKAIRQMLSLNLDVAKEGLVSKSDIENESYLFRAACSELKTTLQATRHSETLTQRSQRAQLQHEFDILNQKVTQDLITLREDLKGLFNDRKLGLQEDKRKIDGKISELNYEITVLLNSEAKSEIEGLRWVLTRRAAMAIGLCACKSTSQREPFPLLNFPLLVRLGQPPTDNVNSHDNIGSQLLLDQDAREGRDREETQGCRQGTGSTRRSSKESKSDPGHADRRRQARCRLRGELGLKSLRISTSARSRRKGL